MADFLVALADFDRRRLWLQLGHASLFAFLHRELGLSAGAAYYRKTAAELIQRLPEVVEPLRDGRLCLTSICELAKVITAENRAEVLPRFFHTSKQEAKAVAAEIAPREAAPHRAVVTAVAPVFAAARQVAAPALDLGHRPFRLDEVPPARANVAAPPTSLAVASPPRTVTEPLTADPRRLHVTVSKRFLEKLEAARDALSHSHPGADMEALLEAGLDLVIERAAARKGLVKRPRTRRKAPTHSLPSAAAVESAEGEEQRPRLIPAAVKREVWVRDGGRCQFRLENGEPCGSTHRLQFDHVRPVALGGESTVPNLRLACSAHNLLAARRIFGDALMDRYAPARPVGGWRRRGDISDPQRGPCGTAASKPAPPRPPRDEPLLLR
jgi:5-methylcytosine-specific restriction endonuclease McrA